MNRDHRLDEFVERVRGLPRLAALDRAAAALFEAFETRSVEALLLKGPALAQLLYRAGEHRAYSDIDVLVSPGDIERARTALRHIGFEGGRALHPTEDLAGVVNAEEWFRTREGDETGAIWVDLHARLAGCHAPAEVAWNAFTRHQAAINIASRTVPVFDRPALALHVAIHAAQHGPDDLKAIGDLQRAATRWPLETWREAKEIAGEVDATAALAGGLRLVAAGAEVAERLGLPKDPETDWTIRTRSQRPRGTFHLEALMRARTVGEQVELLRGSLFPSRRWVRSEYPVARGGPVRLAAGYAQHLSRAPLMVARAWRYRSLQRRAGR